MYKCQTTLNIHHHIRDCQGPMLTDSYPVSNCDYTVESPDANSHRATFRMVLPMLPQTQLMNWMFHPEHRFDGELVTYNLHCEVIEKISFSQAKPTSLRFLYAQHGSPHASLCISLMANDICINTLTTPNNLP
ncbi:MAG: hypothetical protein JXR39_01260 [Marinilabiliaceae bacterium]|nr:hypothetical protein [Marinilabiliaceae bacterium]